MKKTLLLLLIFTIGFSTSTEAQRRKSKKKSKVEQPAPKPKKKSGPKYADFVNSKTKTDDGLLKYIMQTTNTCTKFQNHTLEKKCF